MDQLFWMPTAISLIFIWLAWAFLRSSHRRGVQAHEDNARLGQIIFDLQKERELLMRALIEARKEIEDLRSQVQQVRQDLARFGHVNVQRRLLLVALDADQGFQFDLAALRAVRRGTQALNVMRLINVTKAKLKKYLDRGRQYNRPVELLHLGVHSGPDGMQLGNETLDAAWLSEHLDGVKVLLIAGCSSDVVGDWLGVVPFVVTITEDVSHEDAARFAQAFWMEIAAGHDPDTALNNALQRAPSGMSEYVEHHW